MKFRINRENDKLIVVEQIDAAETDIPHVDIPEETGENILEMMARGDTVWFDSDAKIHNTPTKYRNIPLSDELRIRVIKAADRKLKKYNTVVEMIDYINYIDLNNELNSLGFFITDDNREEKYLEILETGDEHKIDLLEDMLLLKDKLSVLKTAKRAYDEVYEKVQELSEDDTEELRALLSKM